MKKILFLAIGISFFVLVYVHSTPFNCGPVSLSIEKSDSIHDVATKLKEGNCLRSKWLFEKYGVFFDIRVKEGVYVIPTYKNFFQYLFLFEQKTYRQVVNVTIPEGMPNKEIARICQEKLSNCDQKRFLEKAKDIEGYLFPNTYAFFGTESEDDLIAAAQNEFKTQTSTLFIGFSEQEIKNIIILASILEKEADTKKDMYLVSGILHRRLKIDMALQVDATLFYERGKTSAQLSINDLQKDSPYNTYTNRGLPPTPIANPGLVAILAARDPEKSPYLFYLTGNDGVMYYGATFQDHIRNKNLYLR